MYIVWSSQRDDDQVSAVLDLVNCVAIKRKVFESSHKTVRNYGGVAMFPKPRRRFLDVMKI